MNFQGTLCKCLVMPCPCSCHELNEDVKPKRNSGDYLPELFDYECSNCGWEEVVDSTRLSYTKRHPWRLTRRNLAYVVIGMMMVWAYVLFSNVDVTVTPVPDPKVPDNLERVVIVPFFKPLIDRFRSFLQHRTRVIGGDVNRP